LVRDSIHPSIETRESADSRSVALWTTRPIVGSTALESGDLDGWIEVLRVCEAP
jgi:hypothetical protein